MHRHAGEDLAVHQQVVDAGGAPPLERVVGGHDVEVALEPVERLDQLVDQVGRDGVLDDRVPLVRDAAEVLGHLPIGQRPHQCLVR